MKIWKVIFAVALIFGAGVVTGSLVTRARLDQTSASPPRPFPAGPPGPSLWKQPRAEFVHKLQQQLDLSDAQAKEVDQIMRESHERMAKIWEPVAPQAKDETKRVREQIQAALLPDQKSKFDEICKPRRNRDNHDRKKDGNNDNSSKKRDEGKSSPVKSSP